MSLSYLLMLLNPLLMVAGVTYIIIKARPAVAAGTDQQSSDSPDSDDEDPGGGDSNWDWDAPLDLPPGVCLMPSGPEPVHA